jgi:hypothetical protein
VYLRRTFTQRRKESKALPRVLKTFLPTLRLCEKALPLCVKIFQATPQKPQNTHNL